jgi:cytochrome P450
MATEEVAEGAGLASACPVLADYDPLDPAELRDPFPSYARARREAPVFYLEQYGFWSVARRADVLAILRDNERFSTSQAIPLPLPPADVRDRMPVYPVARILFLRDAAEHGPARRMLQAPFTPKRLRALTPMLRTHAEALLRPQDPDRRIEFMTQYATPLALAAVGEIMGVPENDYPMLQRAQAGAVRINSGLLAEDGDEAHAVAQGQLEFWEYLHAITESRRAAPRGDFSSVLANTRNEDGSTPTPDEVAANLATILFAGFHTSAQLMCFAVKALLEHRDQWELLLSDRSLMPTAVEECLRYRGGLRRIFRIAVSDVEIGGVPIPGGSVVSGLLQSCNHDESTFPDPERFDITRKVDNLTFGRGRHFCVGAPLARLELRVTLETLLDLAPDMRLAAGQVLGYPEHLVADMLDGLELDLGPVPDHHREVRTGC